MSDELAFTLWLEWEHFEKWDEDDPAKDFFNMGIDFEDGRTYSLNVWTYRVLERFHQEDLQTGDNLHGSYMLPPDLFVQRRDRLLLEAIVRDLVQHNSLREEWLVKPDDSN